MGDHELRLLLGSTEYTALTMLLEGRSFAEIGEVVVARARRQVSEYAGQKRAERAEARARFADAFTAETSARRRFDRDEAQRLRDEGLTLAAIGERFGVTKEAVRQATEGGPHHRAWTEEERRHAFELSASGLSGYAVARELGRPRSSVAELLRNAPAASV